MGSGSHRSPDGGDLILRRPPLGSGWLRWAAVATARQTVEGLNKIASYFVFD
jgi:hypothetical protein